MTGFSKEGAQDHNHMVRRLVRLYVQECNLPHLINVTNVPTYRADLDNNVAKEAPALHLIKLCYEVLGGDRPAIGIVLNRALEIPSKIDGDYLFHQLSPFIKSLRSYLEKQTPPQDLSVQPYFGFIHDVVSALKDFLKGRPVHYGEIQTLIGTCSSPHFHKFLNSPNEEVLRFDRAHRNRIQQELQHFFSRKLLQWTKDAVKKDKLLIQANRWSVYMEKAKALWRGIGSKGVLRRIMGDKLSEMEILLQEKTPAVLDSPEDQLRAHPSLPLPGSTAATPAASSRSMKRTLSGDTAQTTRAPHKKQRSEEQVIEATDHRAPTHLP